MGEWSMGLGGLRTGGLAVMIALLLPLGGCTKAPQNAEIMPGEEDPLEPYNRAMFGFNSGLDHYLLRPVTVGYRYIVPQAGRTAVSNVVNNLYTPVIFANSVAQGDPQNSFSSMWRFIINTTFGLGGVIDVASDAGLKTRPADFGQTLAIYGVGSGPYVVLPVIGPSNIRDAGGRLTDAFINPFNYISNAASAGIWTATAVDARSNNMKLLDGIYDNSLDPYTTFRSGWTQKRAAEIRRAKAAREKALENSTVQ
jgi:phospholipid-binding lipoprotein MlaA